MAFNPGIDLPAISAKNTRIDGQGDRRMPQLDTLRAFAIGLVIVAHWFPHNAVTQTVPLGMLGVTLFFVLSGFLITQILLQARVATEAAGDDQARALGRFYARRTLRIFPVYYLTLALLFLSGVDDFRGDIGWYLGYAANVLFYRAQAWVGPAPHLWTLSVEEQFYIFWPWVILFAARRHLRKIILATILIGPLARALLFHFSDGSDQASNFAHVLTPSCMDCFGLGALLAYQRVHVDHVFRFAGWRWWLFVVVNALSMLWLMPSYAMTSVLLFRLNVAVLALALIDRASLGIGGPARRLLENPALIYVGRISYGMYLFHLFIPDLYAWLRLPVFAQSGLMFVAWLILLLLLATLSWQLLEKPLNSLKKRYPASAEIGG